MVRKYDFGRFLCTRGEEMTKEEIVLKEFGSKERFEYYKKVFNMTKTKDVLIDAFGKTMYGSSNGEYWIQCNKHYVELRIGKEKQMIGWDWIAKLIDQDADMHIQLSLF